MEIIKEGDTENHNNFYEGYDEFELYQIKDEVLQLEDYIKATYDIKVEYIPETKFDMYTYSEFSFIPDNLDLVRFDIYFKIKK